MRRVRLATAFHAPHEEIAAPGNVWGHLPGDNSKRRGGAGPAWAEVVAAELTGFNHGPHLPVAAP